MENVTIIDSEGRRVDMTAPLAIAAAGDVPAPPEPPEQPDMSVVPFKTKPSTTKTTSAQYVVDPGNVDPVNGFTLRDNFYGFTAVFTPQQMLMPFDGVEQFKCWYEASELMLAGDHAGALAKVTTLGYSVEVQHNGAVVDNFLFCHPMAAQHGTMAGTLYTQSIIDHTALGKRYPVYLHGTENMRGDQLVWTFFAHNPTK